MVENVRDVRASEAYLLNFSGRSFEEISFIQSCGELNDVAFGIILKYLN